jgi:hypothetical protein
MPPASFALKLKSGNNSQDQLPRLGDRASMLRCSNENRGIDHG